EARKIDQTILLNTRLYPDMFPLVRQVQIAADTAKGCAARLAGQEVPQHEDNEASLADLEARIAKTIAFVESLKPQQIDGSEERAMSLGMRKYTLAFKGAKYLTIFVLPNSIFSDTTAYDILRYLGDEIGKGAFISR